MFDVGARVRAARVAASRGLLPDECLLDPVPGVRRQAARAFERWPAAAGLDALRAALRVEPTDTGRLALARAALACGASRSEARAAIAVTWVGGPDGPVDPGAAVGITPGARIRALDAEPSDDGTDTAGSGRAAPKSGEDADELARDLAAAGLPDAWPALIGVGRPLAWWALGEIGAAEATPALIGALGDPTKAPFAAAALQKLGPTTRPHLEAALQGPGAAWAAGVLARTDPEFGARLLVDPRPEVRRAADVADPDERHGMADLRARRWFEAHEAFEAAWRRATGDRRRFLQALVHAAVSLEHHRRGHPDRAMGQWQRCREKLDPPWAHAEPALRAWLDAVGEVHRDGAGDPSTWPIP